ncbi:MAG TPA: polyprenol monophosphomannose synthase [Terriglobales bacterium]|nr:polyprenol monophosphomannose synthase [Terriglobales bacterium]
MDKMLTPESATQPAASAGSAPALALVVPTRREAANLSRVLERIRASLDPLKVSYEIIVVDDDSRDGTESIVQQVSAQDTRVRLLVRRGEHGLAGAISDGWKCSPAEVLGVIDADLQHPPELLPQLWEKLQSGYDLVIASRYAQPGSMRSWNPLRRAVSQAGVLLAQPLQRSAIQVKDPLSGFFLVRRHCLAGLNLQRQGFKLLLEILVRGKIASVAEVPFIFGTRQGGASKAGLSTGLHYFYLVARLWRRKPYKH